MPQFLHFLQHMTGPLSVLIGIVIVTVMTLDFLRQKGVNVQQAASNAFQNVQNNLHSSQQQQQGTQLKTQPIIGSPDDTTAIQTMVDDFQKVGHAFHYFTKEGGSQAAARQLLLDYVDRVAPLPPTEGAKA